jgi:protease I
VTDAFQKGQLAGKRIAVVVEKQFIPAEIDAYRTYFGHAGASVDLVTRVWSADRPEVFFSDVISDLSVTTDWQERQKLVQVGYEFDPDGVPLRVPVSHLKVDLDFRNVELDAYAAVLVAANYISVRLRYYGDMDIEKGAPVAEAVKCAPAVKFFAKAMQNPRVVKGALCHALWLLTPTGLLKDRKVICHEVVRADVINAGAIVDPNQLVVTDGDLITGHSAHEATQPGPNGIPPYIEAIKSAILAKGSG